MTQSYPFDVANGTATNIGTNPYDISRDPDFLQINPEFKPDGYTVLIGGGLGRLLVNSGLTDSADLLWRYILADADCPRLPGRQGRPVGDEAQRALSRTHAADRPLSRAPTSAARCRRTLRRALTLPNCTLDVFPYGGGCSATAAR